MPLPQTTITGTVYDAEGDPAASLPVYIHKVIKSGTVLQHKKKTVGQSDSLGAISFTAPRDSNIWLGGAFYAGSLYFNVSTGVSVVIPDAPSTTLETLGASVVLPVQGVILGVRTVLVSDTAIATDDVIFASTSAAGFTLTLMPAALRTRELIIKVIGSVQDNLLTLAAAGGEIIDGLASDTWVVGDVIRLIPRTSTAWETI